MALVMLAVMSSRASPGFPLAEVPKAVGKSIAKALGAKPEAPARPNGTGQRAASSFALADIPRRYLGFYADAATACRGCRDVEIIKGFLSGACRPCENRAGAVLDDRPLNQIRMSERSRSPSFSVL